MAPSGGRPQVEEIDSRGVAPVLIPDPGDGGAIDVSRSGFCDITTTGVDDTRTLGDPSFRGQEIMITFVSDGGNAVITAASPVNQAGNTIITFSDIGESCVLRGHWNATDGWEWVAINLANGEGYS